MQLRSLLRVQFGQVHLWSHLLRAKITFAVLAIAALVLVRFSLAQQQDSHSANKQHVSSMDGMDMSKDSDDQGASAATGMMSSHHMDMGPHMKMTDLRGPQAGDQERAAEVVNEAKEVMQKYQDYHVALDDGFKIFLPNVPQHQYHFTNYRYGFEAHFRFNPEHPTSLLYDNTADGYKLAGVMYTAPAKASEDELNQRIPLSVAQWHEHVNFCFPPKDRDSNPELVQKDPRFGMGGSISTKEACDQAGGRFVPLVFGWMVHVYPNEKDVWAMGPGMHHHD
jgi:hypothetical protein